MLQVRTEAKVTSSPGTTFAIGNGGAAHPEHRREPVAQQLNPVTLPPT
ncbi:MAG: hypothetical protein KBA08_04540 [Firmicutes bacterium]|nr:hypothetical protein [Bacillota bacterium]